MDPIAATKARPIVMGRKNERNKPRVTANLYAGTCTVFGTSNR
jgi:hypothetical protein